MRRQCELLGLARASWYYEPARESAENLKLMRRIDEQYLATPFYGSRRMAVWLQRQGYVVNRKRVQRLMRVHGHRGDLPEAADDAAGGGTQDLPVFAAGCGDDAAGPGVERGHHLRAAAARVLVPGGGDGLVQPLRAGVAVVEHAGGQLLRRGLDEALAHGRPEIFNTDQGVQFTSAAFTCRLQPRAWRSAWTAAAGRWTTCSSNGCGGP